MKHLHFGFDSLLKGLVVVALLAFGLQPRPVAAQPFVYVANSLTNDFASINAFTSAVVPPFIPNGPGVVLPAEVAITPDGAYAWVTNAIGESVSVISTALNTVVAVVPLETPTDASILRGIAINPVPDAAGRIDAYVVNQVHGTVSVIDTALALTNPTNAVVSTVPLPAGATPLGVAVTPNGKQAWVTDPGTNSVLVIDTALAVSNPAAAVVKVIGSSPSLNLDLPGYVFHPVAVAITPDGTQAWVVGGDCVSSGCGDGIEGIDTTTYAEGLVSAGSATAPDAAIAFTPNGVAYVAGNGNAGEVLAIGSAGIPVGHNPSAIAITQDGTQAWVTNTGDSTVSVINTAVNKVVGNPIPTEVPGAAPIGIAIQGPYTAQPSAGTAALAGVPVGFNVTVPNASLVGSVTWDFFGSGTVVRTTSTLNTQFAYPGAGTFTPKVTVLGVFGGVLLAKKIPVHVQSTVQAIFTAATLVKLLRSLTSAQQASLINTLNVALQDLDQGNRTGAFNQMGLFINQLSALVQTGQLTARAAAPALGEGRAIQISINNSVPFLLGTGELAPKGGSSEVGEPVTFTVTWTVPSEKSWRDLQHLDLRVVEKVERREEEGEGESEANEPLIALWARFNVGNPSTFALLDAKGNLVGTGLPGSTGVLETNTATLDLAESSFQGSGPTGPSVTVNFVVSFKAPAAGEDSARVYTAELLATDVLGQVQGPEKVGHWVVRPLHH